MFYYVILAMTALAFVMCHALLRSRVGYYWQAIREDELAARSLGINTFRYKMIAIVVSAGMTAPAGRRRRKSAISASALAGSSDRTHPRDRRTRKRSRLGTSKVATNASWTASAIADRRASDHTSSTSIRTAGMPPSRTNRCYR